MDKMDKMAASEPRLLQPVSAATGAIAQSSKSILLDVYRCGW